MESNQRPKAQMTFEKAIGRFTQLFSRKKVESEKEGDLTVRFNKAKSGTTELNEEAKKFVSKNVHRSTTYSIYSFLPCVIFNQFRIFYNLYFLAISILHCFPVFQVGFWWTSFMPLGLFLFTSMIKEGYGDYHRYKRDQEINDESFLKISGDTSETIASRDICAGDLIVVKAGQRVPADMILFGTDHKSEGSVFIKTDQLDGETDWKLRSCISSLKGLEETELAKIDDIVVRITPPNIKIHTFNGIIERNGFIERLNMDNVIWGNSVLATGSAIGFVIYTGANTKCSLNIESPPFKLSLLESEANYFAKLLFLLQLAMTIGLTFSRGAPERWLVQLIMFLMILSYIVPI